MSFLKCAYTGVPASQMEASRGVDALYLDHVSYLVCLGCGDAELDRVLWPLNACDIVICRLLYFRRGWS
jgi:hypothetical protein